MPGVTIDGQLHYAVQMIVLGTPRPSGRPIDVTKVDGSVLVVRDPGTQAPFVPITLTGEAAGLSQVFLSPEPEGLASCDGGPPTHWSTSQYAEMLAAAVTSAAEATAARQSAADAVATSAILTSQNADLEERVNAALETIAAGGGGTGGGGTGLLGPFASEAEGLAATTAGQAYIVVEPT